MDDTQFSFSSCLFICLRNTSVDSYIEDDFFYKIFLELTFSGWNYDVCAHIVQ